MTSPEGIDQTTGRPEEPSGRPDFIDFAWDDPKTTQERIKELSTENLRDRKLQRAMDREDRLDWVHRWQQRLILAFLIYCFVVAGISAGWAIYVVLWGGAHEQTERAFHIFKILMDAGIAALVGFFAIKRFEK